MVDLIGDWPRLGAIPTCAPQPADALQRRVAYSTPPLISNHQPQHHHEHAFESTRFTVAEYAGQFQGTPFALYFGFSLSTILIEHSRTFVLVPRTRRTATLSYSPP